MPASSTLKVLRTEEHKAVPCVDQDTHELLVHAMKSRRSGAESLGLHAENEGFAPGNYIGAVWLDDNKNSIALVVLPKHEFQQMDYLRMYLRCAANRKPASKCIDIWPAQPLIAAQAHPLPSGLLIASFLHELNRLCSRHFRSHFRPQTANLSGKIKGRIRVDLQFQRNLARGRPDRTWCTYQTIQQDILENRVLRTALERSVKQLQQSKDALDPSALRQLWQWIRKCRTALAGVSATAVSHSQLRQLRTTGAFTHYRQSLTLARFILLSIGVDSPDPDDITDKPAFATPPFAIHSAELFEQFAQTVLKQDERFAGIEPGKNISSADRNENATVRPDYCVSRRGGGPIILDIKYKRGETGARADLFQMIAYSQHKELCAKLGCDEQKPDLYLVYPRLDDSENYSVKDISEITAFSVAIKRISINCPRKNALPMSTPRK